MNEEPVRRPEAARRTLSTNGTGPAHVPPQAPEGSDDAAPEQVETDPGRASDRLAMATEPDLPRRPPGSARREVLGGVREIVETVVLALIFFFALRAVVQNFRVEGSSMYPNFLDGQYVLVNKAVYGHVDSGTLPGWVPRVGGGSGPARYIFHAPERGDVIVFHPPPPNDPRRDFIKRVIGVPGDTVEVREGRVYVNGSQLIEPYIHEATLPINSRFSHVSLGPDQYFVLGDNRGNSSDSRAWGTVAADEIVGRTWLVYWPISAWKVAPNHAEHVPAPAAASP